MKRAGPEETLRCSFCQKTQDTVGKLISSPGEHPRAYICDECVGVCNTILEEDHSERLPSVQTRLSRPVEVKAFLDQYVIGQEKTKKKLAVAVRACFGLETGNWAAGEGPRPGQAGGGAAVMACATASIPLPTTINEPERMPSQLSWLFPHYTARRIVIVAA